jgi:NADH-quinone oxidoreductase subunit L
VAGFVGIPAALGGSNAFHHFLQPAIGPIVPVGEVISAHGEEAAHAAAHGSRALELTLMTFSVLSGVVGIAIAHRFYIKNPDTPRRIAQRVQGLYRIVYNKYFVDEAYEASIVRPGYKLSESFLYRVIDVWVIDGIVNGVGIFTRLLGSAIRLFQTGAVRTYALFFLLGLLFLIFKLAG